MHSNASPNPHYYQQPLREVLRSEVPECAPETPVLEAARLMQQSQSSAILIRGGASGFQGIFTDKDLRNRVVAGGLPLETPVSDVMSTPLSAISESKTVFDALLTMNLNNVMHLGVTDAQGQVRGLVRHHALIAQGYSQFYLLRALESAQSVEEMAALQQQIPEVVSTLLEAGMPVLSITQLISLFADTVLETLLKQALKEMGEPPANFVFLTLGSEGRQEQTLKTDQDNAILFEDVPKERLGEVQSWFLEFGEKVCTRLDRVGYALCEGNVMARNPQWCQPLSIWKGYFQQWIETPEPVAVIRATIFFDFRASHGKTALAEELQEHLWTLLHERNQLFLFHLSRAAQQMQPPLSWWGGLALEKGGAHDHTFDVKKAMTPVVDGARFFSLKNHLASTNTSERLDRLLEAGELHPEDHRMLQEGYEFLMRLRLRHQVEKIREGLPADNHLDPRECSPVEQKLLTNILGASKKALSMMRRQFPELP